MLLIRFFLFVAVGDTSIFVLFSYLFAAPTWRPFEVLRYE